jgi:hypothetical protein
MKKKDKKLLKALVNELKSKTAAASAALDKSLSEAEQTLIELRKKRPISK